MPRLPRLGHLLRDVTTLAALGLDANAARHDRGEQLVDRHHGPGTGQSGDQHYPDELAKPAPPAFAAGAAHELSPRVAQLLPLLAQLGGLLAVALAVRARVARRVELRLEMLDAHVHRRALALVRRGHAARGLLCGRLGQLRLELLHALLELRDLLVIASRRGRGLVLRLQLADLRLQRVDRGLRPVVGGVARLLRFELFAQ